MKVTFGLTAHSGWAAFIALGKKPGEIVVVDRRRIELAEDEWARQPYHAAESLKPEAAQVLVKRGVEAAYRIALREIRAAIKRERAQKNEVVACGLLVGNPMPDWSTDEILAVHFRMHKAEGVLFRDALASAASKCALSLVSIPEKDVMNHAVNVLGLSNDGVLKIVAALGRSVGPPWGKDQKHATLAALVALQQHA